ncbi:ribonuclease H-like domain-containing protein [Tanacetum coccineum]|uniref:Ribonuclease H-like domain-containing protein n=1 Tax=Tanacetum coccineum TaxID=301880 RepID=A0ABQ4WM26_9ASTR
MDDPSSSHLIFSGTKDGQMILGYEVKEGSMKNWIFEGVICKVDQFPSFAYMLLFVSLLMAVEDDVNKNGDSSKKVIGSSSDLNLSFGDPLYLHPNDTSGSPIVTVKLTDMCNSVVVTWILISLSSDLFAGAIYAKYACEMWNDLKETYDKQFDAMVSLPPCTCEAAKHFEKHNQLIKLMQFLMHLNESYLAIRSNLFTKEPLPHVKNAFAVISGEESHRNVTSVRTTKPDATAFAAKTFDNNKRRFNNNNFKRSGSNSNSNNRGPNPNLKCTNCNKIGHTVDICFELVGYPTGYVKRNFNANTRPVSSNNVSADVHANSISSNNATSSNSPVSLSNEQLARLMNLLNENDVSTANANMVANQYMTASAKFLINVVDISNLGLTVGHTNGTQVLITKIGESKINNDITLYDVLVVPEYTVSLLSVHKLSRDSKLFVGFDESNCYIQDLKANKNVGIGKQFNGLYLFDVDNAWRVSSNDDDTELSPDIQGNDDSEATSMDENNTHHEGTVPNETDFVNDFYENSEFNSEVEDLPVHTVRRSSRQTKLPTSLNDFVIEGKVKYGVEKVVNYANLNHENFCFASGLNKKIPQGFANKDNKNKENDFVQFVNDHSLFTKSKNNKFIALLVYVDDIVITGNCMNEIENFKTFLKSKFKFKDLGSIKYFLGIKVIKTVSTPMEPNSILPYVATKDDPLLNNISAQYMHSPLKSYLNCAMNVLRYLKNAPEAEYISLSSAAYEIIWIQKLLFDLKSKSTLPDDLFCDNKSALQLVVNLVFHERAAKRWVDRLAPGTINTWDLLKKAFIQRYFPPSKTAKQLEDIHNFTQEGPIPGMTPAQDLTAIQTMADHSQKWHDGTTSRNIGSSNSNDGLAALVNKLDNLGRDMKKLKESVHAIQVGCQICEGPHLDKDCPLNEEVKQVEEIDNRPLYGERRQSLEELLIKHQEESARRSTKMEIEQLTEELHSRKEKSEQAKVVIVEHEGPRSPKKLKNLHRISFLCDSQEENTIDQLPIKESNPGHFTLPCTIGRRFCLEQKVKFKEGHLDISKSVRKDLLRLWVIDRFTKALDPDKNPLERCLDEYKWVFHSKIEELADEYEIKIGEKGQILKDIWEKCKRARCKNKDLWYDYWYEDEEKTKLGNKDYNPPMVHTETFEVTKYKFDNRCSFTCVSGENNETLSLGRKNGSRFRKMITEEMEEVLGNDDEDSNNET